MLNKEGIELLKSDLRKNAKHYNQQRFGIIALECGTEACMAGMCLMREIGYDKFTAYVREAYNDNSSAPFDCFKNDCLESATRQLGLTLLDDEEYDIKFDTNLPPIFAEHYHWPDDLNDEYREAEDKHDHQAMVEVACKALDRIDENGCFV